MTSIQKRRKKQVFVNTYICRVVLFWAICGMDKNSKQKIEAEIETEFHGLINREILFQFQLHNIKIKHVFLCINICWTPRVVLKPKPERRGF